MTGVSAGYLKIWARHPQNAQSPGRSQASLLQWKITSAPLFMYLANRQHRTQVDSSIVEARLYDVDV